MAVAFYNFLFGKKKNILPDSHKKLFFLWNFLVKLTIWQE